MSKKNKPDHIGFVLGELVGKKNWGQRFELHSVFTFWDEIVGADVAAQAKPYKMHGMVLWVEVTESVWLQQLQYLKMDFVAKINARFTGVGVTDIRFSLKQQRQGESEKSRDWPRPGPAPTEAEIEQFAKTVSTIDDPELMQSMRRCWEALYHYKNR